MDYRKLYNEIIENRRANPISGYTETHHIIPRSLGGTNNRVNLVNLTAREHFLCHYLLTKIYEPNTYEWHKMLHAFIPMRAESDEQNRYFNSRLYESARKNFSSVMSQSQIGIKNSQHGTRWIHNKSIKRSQKILLDRKLPDGWEEGRIINWNTKQLSCVMCNAAFEVRSIKQKKYCSSTCRQKARMTGSHFDGREQEFLTLYKKYRSMNRALKEMGYDARGSRYYWAKNVLDKNQQSKTN